MNKEVFKIIKYTYRYVILKKRETFTLLDFVVILFILMKVLWEKFSRLKYYIHDNNYITMIMHLI